MQFCNENPGEQHTHKIDEKKLKRTIEAGTKAWKDVKDPVKWVRSIRG